MAAFSAYSIPIQGLKSGIHSFKYGLDQDFFKNFEDSPIGMSEISCTMVLDKRPDMMVFDFDLEGWTEAICDRCTALIQLPLESQRQLVVKYGEQADVAEDEVVYIPRDAPNFNVAQYLYEFAILSLPITNTYDCESDATPPCNMDILKFLGDTPNQDSSNSVWDALKGINKK